MNDIITFGSAAQDIYLNSKKFLKVKGRKFATGEGICFNLGSKIEVENAFFSSGGGGTNTAATFAKQGFKAAYCGMVGDDYSGNSIIRELESLGIVTDFIIKTKKKPTNASVILAYPGGDRTILVYRGASDILKKEEIPWSEIKKTKWFYLAPFSGKLANFTEDLVSFAKINKIKVAINPGYKQLSLTRATLEKILDKVDVLILNQEEASLITKIPYQKENNVFKKLDELVSGICVMTKGDRGAVASDGKYIYKADALKVEKADITGGGDSFGAGFVSGLMAKNDIVFAMQLGIANSASNLKKVGAKEGLLRNNQSFPRVKVNCKKL